MNQTEEAVEVNGIELEEGDDLWRLKALRAFNQKFSDQEADEVIQETAEALAENYPEAVNGAPAHIVAENLKGTPGIYDGTDLMRYHAMEVAAVRSRHGTTEVVLKDWKEEQRHCFRDPPYEDAEDGYGTVYEDWSALEDHLGTTILPVGGDGEEA